MSMFKNVRAAAVLGFTWVVPWAATGVALITWRVFALSPRLVYPLRYWPTFALRSGLVFGAVGFVTGVLFAFTLSKTARGRTVDRLSRDYAARWGALAGAASIVVVPLVGHIAWPALAVAGAAFALIGAGPAMATPGLARRSTGYEALTPGDASE
jgi:hypothetical protein